MSEEKKARHVMDDVHRAMPHPDEGQASGPVSMPTNMEIFFPLPSNRQQKEIIERIAHHQGVLVQGPPGTGKSHTIANLICHLLTAGNRILITSHTPRALKVLQSKLPQDYSALCVSLLGEDQSSMKALENSVYGITNKFNHWDSSQYEDQFEKAEKSLHNIRTKVAQLHHDRRILRERETIKNENIFGQYSGTLAVIAEQINTEAKQYCWLKGTIGENETPPISDQSAEELINLLKETASLPSVPDADWLPAVEHVPLPKDCEDWFRQYEENQKHANDLALCRKNPTYKIVQRMVGQTLDDLIRCVSAARHSLNVLNKYKYPWLNKCLTQICSERDRVWKELLAVTRDHLDSINEDVAIADDVKVTGLPSSEYLGLRVSAEDLLKHLESGGSSNYFLRFFQPANIRSAVKDLKSIHINGRSAISRHGLSILICWLRARERLTQLHGIWRNLEGEVGKGTMKVEIAEYEDFCEPLEQAIKLYDCIQTFKKLCPHMAQPSWLEKAKMAEYQCVLFSVQSDFKLQTLDQQIHSSMEKISKGSNGRPMHVSVQELLASLRTHNDSSYLLAYSAFVAANSWRTKKNRVAKILQPLKKVVPSAAIALESMDDTALKSFLPFSKAWTWLKTLNWINKLNDPTYKKQLASEIDLAIKHERTLLCQMGALKAWRFCFSRMDENQRQNLVAWTKAVKNLGKGTGKYANKWRRAARESMNKCRSAIPAWIMPFYRIAETIRPGVDVFDVAIIDEASQSGPEALCLYYLAKKIIVVGDDKQISPDSIGVNREDVQALRQKYISDLPHSEHIGVEDSFFDLAEIQFSGRIRLREHFRCMPEIIEFSNRLCYHSEPLIPLRHLGSSRLSPVVVTEHLPTGYQVGASGKICNPAEAQAIVDTIARLIKDPRYAQKTFGVISLLGETQAQQIGRMLIENIGPEEMERRELVCGDAYAFQGDERDVIFLSMVSAPTEGHRIGALTQAKDERRFNVAASRAKDQMWLFHSVALNDLSQNCVRYKLLAYCLNPSTETLSLAGMDMNQLRLLALNSDRQIVKPPSPFDSWFEVDVFLKIHDKGFRVVPQYAVAGRRIDLVVEGMYGRIAVECYGDHWHGPEKWADDNFRQQELERCGWEFWIVWESDFKVDPDRAMASLWEIFAKKESEKKGSSFILDVTNYQDSHAQLTKNLNNTPTVQNDAELINLLPVGQSAQETLADENEDLIEAGSENQQTPSNTGSRHTSSNEIIPILLQIIETKGPMVCKSAYDEYASQEQLGRLGRLIISDLNKAMRKAIKAGQLVQENEFKTNDIVKQVVRLPNQQRVLVRPRKGRDLMEIPPSEFAAVMAQCQADNPEISKEDLLLTTLRHYGFQRTTEVVKKYFDHAWRIFEQLFNH